MTGEYLTLVEQVEQLEQRLLDSQIENNIKDARISDLEKSLAAARAEVRKYELGTQTMRRLQILGDSDDDNGCDPRSTGKFRAWEGIVR